MSSCTVGVFITSAAALTASLDSFSTKPERDKCAYCIMNNRAGPADIPRNHRLADFLHLVPEFKDKPFRALGANAGRSW